MPDAGRFPAEELTPWPSTQVKSTSSAVVEPKNVLLVSNTVMHYRVSVYNYFWRRFREDGYHFQVLTNRLQPQNQIAPQFPITEMPFRFRLYRRAILERRPAVVILFLHLKDKMFWPLVHWLKWRRI